MFGKYDDVFDNDGSDLLAITDILDNAGIDYEVEEDDDENTVVLENGISLQFDSDMNLVSINPPKKKQ